jgi:hypothetical protein
MSDPSKILWYSVGCAFRGGGVEQVSISMSSDQLFFSPELAREFAIDILIQCDKVEKRKTWKALKNSDSEK